MTNTCGVPTNIGGCRRDIDGCWSTRGRYLANVDQCWSDLARRWSTSATTLLANIDQCSNTSASDGQNQKRRCQQRPAQRSMYAERRRLALGSKPSRQQVSDHHTEEAWPREPAVRRDFDEDALASLAILLVAGDGHFLMIGRSWRSPGAWRKADGRVARVQGTRTVQAATGSASAGRSRGRVAAVAGAVGRITKRRAGHHPSSAKGTVDRVGTTKSAQSMQPSLPRSKIDEATLHKLSLLRKLKGAWRR